MNKSMIYSKIKSNLFYQILIIILLVLYGTYKNGYLLYKNNYEDSFIIIKIFIYPLFSILTGYFFSKIFISKRKEIINFSVIAGLSALFNFNIIIYLLLLIGIIFLIRYVPNNLKINEGALFISICILLNYLFNNSIIHNSMELTNLYKYSLNDLFFGRGISFLFTSNICFLFITYIVFCFSKLYKKIIPFISFLTYLILVTIYMFITMDYMNNIYLLLNGITIFSFIFLAPNNISSPSTIKEMYLYAVLIGIISFAFVNILDIFTGSIFAVLIMSVLYRIYIIFRQKKFLNK